MKVINTQTILRGGIALGVGTIAVVALAGSSDQTAQNAPVVRPVVARKVAATVPSVEARLNQLGAENKRLALRVGVWDVTETALAAPGTPPTVTTSVAERKMVGSYLQETLRPFLGSPRVLRMDYLSFHRIEGRWKYVSMDMRVAAGIMSASSFGRGQTGRVDLRFEPFAFSSKGQMVQMNQITVFQDANHDRKVQRFTVADGSGQTLTHQYSYTRRPPGSRRAAATPPPRGASGRIDAIRRRGTLRVAVLDEYPWLKQTDGGAKPFQGPAWRLAEEYAGRLGVRLETVPVGFGNKVSVLASGQADITIAPLLATPERAKDVDLVLYSMSAQSLFGRADNPKVARARSISDLNRGDVTIAYIAGSPQGNWLQRRLPRAARRAVPGTLADVPVQEILSRRADVTTIDKFFFAGLSQKTPGLASIPRAYLTSQELPIPIGMAISRKQPVFLAWLRAVAQEIRPQVVAAQAQVEKAGS